MKKLLHRDLVALGLTSEQASSVAEYLNKSGWVRSSKYGSFQVGDRTYFLDRRHLRVLARLPNTSQGPVIADLVRTGLAEPLNTHPPVVYRATHDGQEILDGLKSQH